MSGELAVAVLAEHVCTGSPLDEIVQRLGATDRASLASEAMVVQDAAIRLRDLASPRRSDRDSSPVTVRNAAPVRNRYAGSCACGRHVPEGRGRAVKAQPGKWTLYCYPCSKEKGYA